MTAHEDDEQAGSARRTDGAGPLRRLLRAVRMPADRTYRGGPLPRRSGGQQARTDATGAPADPTPELTRRDAEAEQRKEL